MRWSVWSTSPANGSTPPGTGARVTATGMIPITSYHEAREVSYVALVVTTSPLRKFTFQSGAVADIATSQETLRTRSK